MAEETIKALVERFADLPDSRVQGRCDHDLLDIVVLALCAVMSGAQGWDDIEDWGVTKREWLSRYLKLRNGIPGHDTIRRVFESLDPKHLAERFEAWAGQVCPKVTGRVIAVDGKALRGSGRTSGGLKAIHQVAAYAAEYGLTLGQRACEEKSNEITAIKELLPSLALKGATVTIDAMGCQTEIAQQIVAQGGHYVLAVKDNQPQLAQALREFFATPSALTQRQQAVSTHETLDKGHGRLEQRCCTAVGDLQWLQDMGLKERWSGLVSIACIYSTRQIGDKHESDTRYVISSLPADAPALLHAVRTHWGIENALHWCLDVTFREDASAIRLRNAAQNFSLLRRIALNLFKAETASKRSMPKKRKAAAWNHEYLIELLGLREI